MHIVFLLLSTALAVYDSGYMYYHGECSVLESDNAPIYLGIELDLCQEVSSVDRELNTVYHHKISSLDAARRNILRNEQRRWIVLTQNRCGMSPVGSIAHGDEAVCFIREARLRTIILRRWGATKSG
jgi:uncharacterized protein YecT (DUF1311 family)